MRGNSAPLGLGGWLAVLALFGIPLVCVVGFVAGIAVTVAGGDGGGLAWGFGLPLIPIGAAVAKGLSRERHEAADAGNAADAEAVDADAVAWDKIRPECDTDGCE